MISKRNISRVQNFYNIKKIPNIEKKYNELIDNQLKDIISNVLSQNKKEINLNDIQKQDYIMSGGTSLYDGYCDSSANGQNISQCDIVSDSSTCQTGGYAMLYDGYCDSSTTNPNISQCDIVMTGDTCGGSRPYLMNLKDFKSETNSIIKKYKNEIGYDNIKINQSALKQLRTLIENNIIFS